jgi:hypothetical protein
MGSWLLALLALPFHAGAVRPSSPQLFSPGVISGTSNDDSPAFTPDGDTVFFTRFNRALNHVILMSHRNRGRWSTPTIASFSGRWMDLEPTMAPDGSYLVFSSSRPVDGSGKTLDGAYLGKTFPGAGGNLWRVNRQGDRWGEPFRLPETINRNSNIFSPSIAADGTIYFMEPDIRTGNFHLLRSRFVHGSYQPAEVLDFGRTGSDDVDPAVAPDQSFIVFSTRQKATAVLRLVIAFRQGRGWSHPVDLGDIVNKQGSNVEARLGPDHRTLYFSTSTDEPAHFPRSHAQAQRDLARMAQWDNGSDNIWFVSLAPWLDGRQANHARTHGPAPAATP